MEAIKNKTGKYEQKLASKSLKLLKESQSKINTDKRKVKLTIQDSNEIVEIPIDAYSYLKDILKIMAEGNDLMIMETKSELSTQQAANILNVSRPHLVKLLESGQIAFKKAGTHRRILVKDIIQYKSNLEKNRRKNLNALAKQAQELNLGY